MSRHREPDPAVLPAIADDNAPVPPARRPTAWRVGRVRAIAFSFVVVAVALSLLSAYVSWTVARDSAERAAAVDARLAVLEEDLAERTAQRDAERDAAAARDRATRAELVALLCELLGGLPADSSNLDAIRAALACPQPGMNGPAPSNRPVGPATSSPPLPRPAEPPPAAEDARPRPAPPAPSSPPPAQPAPRPSPLPCTSVFLPVIC